MPEPKTLDGAVQWFRDRGHGAGHGVAKMKMRRGWFYSLVINIVLVVVVSAVLMSLLPVAM